MSKESLAIASNFSASRGLIVIEADAGGRKWKVARLTDKGAVAGDLYEDLLSSLEQRWRDRFGGDVMDRLRTSLERLTGPGGRESPLFPAWSHIRTAGEPRSGRQRPCRTTRWCCIAAATQTGAEAAGPEAG